MREGNFFSFRSPRDDRIIIINKKRKTMQINRFSFWRVWKTENSIYFLREYKQFRCTRNFFFLK